MNDRMDVKAFDTATTWYRSNCIDTLLYKGVSIGAIHQIMTAEFFFEGSNTVDQSKSIRAFVKERGWHWQIRFILGMFEKYGQSEFSSKAGDIVVLYDVNNDPMIGLLNAIKLHVEDNGGECAAVVADRNIAGKVTGKSTIYSHSKYYGLIDEIMSQNDYNDLCKRFDSVFSVYVDNIQRTMDCDKKTAVLFLKKFKNQMKQTIREIVATESLLKMLAPKVVLASTDAHRIARIVMQVANKLDIKTCVIQHGAPTWEYGYLPVYADRIMVWGADYAEWFRSRGTDSSRIAVTGNPRFDKSFKNHVVSQGSNSVFVLPNPVDRELTRVLIAESIRCALECGRRVVIKLHPSEKDIEWFKGLIPDGKESRVEVLSCALDKVGIGLGDIVCVGNSTAGIDAVIFGAKVVNVVFDEMPNPVEYQKYGVGVAVSVSQMSAGFETCLSMSESDLLMNRRRFIDAILNGLDGESAARIEQVIKSIS